MCCIISRFSQLDKKQKKRTTNPISDDDKCSQYAATVALNYGKTEKKFAKNIEKNKFFINKHNWKGKNYPLDKDDWKTFEENVQQLLLLCYMLKKWIYILSTFQNTTQIMKNKSSL